jgi:hypothetical protein
MRGSLVTPDDRLHHIFVVPECQQVTSAFVLSQNLFSNLVVRSPPIIRLVNKKSVPNAVCFCLAADAVTISFMTLSNKIF